MTIEDQLRNYYSKGTCMEVAARASSDKVEMLELINLLAKGEAGVCERAAWALSFIPVKKLQPHSVFLVSLLDKPLHVAVRRNILRVFQESQLPEELQGALAEICFRFLHSIHEPPAVKAFAMTVLYRICELHPELGNELRITVEEMIPFGQPAIVSRGNRILKLLRKLK